jgi:LPS export ABC transporter protein LptC
VKLFSRLRAFGKELQRAIFSRRTPSGTYRSMRRLRLALLGVALLIILIVAGSAFKEKRTPTIVKVNETQSPPGDANFELKDVSYGYTNKNNEKEWELRAAKAQYFKDQKLVKLEDIEVTLYRPNGQIYKLSGKHGELNIDTQNISMQGAVKGSMPDNTQFATESFSYDNNKRILTTHDKVFITRDTFSMEGVGMIINVKEETLALLDKVQATENR